MAKLLVWDLETSTSGFKANAGFIICATFKEPGRPVEVLRRDNMLPDPLNDKKLVKKIYDRLMKADMWVTHNGKWFDIPFLNSRLLKWGLPVLPSKFPHFDTCEASFKRLKIRNSLEAVGEFFGINTKKFTVSHDEWSRAYAGNERAIKMIVKHGVQDVKLTEKVYDRMKIVGYKHPNVALINSSDDACPYCGKSGTLRDGGWNYAQVKKSKRYFCRPNKGGCGGWSHGPYVVTGTKIRL